MNPTIYYSSDLADVDWAALKSSLAADKFDNGRSPEQLRRAFENSFAVALACCDGQIVGTARVLSDGVSNAYLVDVWTMSRFRRRGIARALMDSLEQAAYASGFTLLLLDTCKGYDAERLYASTGWVRVGEVPGFALNPDRTLCDTVFFYKQLSPPFARARQEA